MCLVWTLNIVLYIMLLEVCEQLSLVAVNDYTELHNVAWLAFGQAVGYGFL